MLTNFLWWFLLSVFLVQLSSLLVFLFCDIYDVLWSSGWTRTRKEPSKRNANDSKY